MGKRLLAGALALAAVVAGGVIGGGSAQASTPATATGLCSFGGGNADTVTVTWAFDFDTTTQLVGFHPVSIAFRQTQSRNGYVTTIKQATYEWQNGKAMRAKTMLTWKYPGVKAATFTPTTTPWSWSTQTDYFVVVGLVNRNGAVCVAKVPFAAH